jgi:predicted kinase
MRGMQSPTLYLFIGAPGAGKTTTAQIIAEYTGAVHLWADSERHKLFTEPTHLRQESDFLYEKLNNKTDQLLAQGKSVVFDTNFNFYADRQKLAAIAARNKAETRIIWMTTHQAISKARAVGTHKNRNGYTMTMTDEQFDAIVAKLEPPNDSENTIKIDGSKVDRQTIIDVLHLESV